MARAGVFSFMMEKTIGPEQNRLEKSISSETLYTCNHKVRSLTLRRTAEGIREWSPILVNNLLYQDVTPVNMQGTISPWLSVSECVERRTNNKSYTRAIHFSNFQKSCRVNGAITYVVSFYFLFQTTPRKKAIMINQSFNVSIKIMCGSRLVLVR